MLEPAEVRSRAGPQILRLAPAGFGEQPKEHHGQCRGQEGHQPGDSEPAVGVGHRTEYDQAGHRPGTPAASDQPATGAVPTWGTARWTPGRSPRAWRRFPHDFRMEPRAGREHRQILLFSRVLTLNEQEAASGDAERVRLVVGHLAVCCRGTAQINLDSHDRHPSHAAGYASLPRYSRTRPAVGDHVTGAAGDGCQTSPSAACSGPVEWELGKLMRDMRPGYMRHRAHGRVPHRILRGRRRPSAGLQWRFAWPGGGVRRVRSASVTASRRFRRGGPGHRRRCALGWWVRAAAGVPGSDSGCGGRSSA
jgi:hypothetical protein